jgi:hypothetical protein
MATAAAAAAVARAGRDVRHHFFSQDAVRPDSAVSFEPGSRLQRRIFQRMSESGIIREAKPGQYWIDVVAYDRDRTARFQRLRVVLLCLVFALLAGLLLVLVLR